MGESVHEKSPWPVPPGTFGTTAWNIRVYKNFIEKDDVELSPQFDFEEDAMLWRTRMIHILCKGKNDI
jgi:hypothetical protein